MMQDPKAVLVCGSPDCGGVHGVASTSLPAGHPRGGKTAHSGTGDLYAFYGHELWGECTRARGPISGSLTIRLTWLWNMQHGWECMDRRSAKDPILGSGCVGSNQSWFTQQVMLIRATFRRRSASTGCRVVSKPLVSFYLELKSI